MFVYFQEYQVPSVESYATHTYLHMRGPGNLWWQFQRVMLRISSKNAIFLYVFFLKHF